MKKILLILVILLVFGGFVSAVEFYVTPKIDTGLSLYQGWFVPSVQLELELNKVIGFGIESAFWFGSDFKDAYNSEALLFMLGPVYLGGGISFKLKDAVPNQDYQIFTYGKSEEEVYGNENILPYITTGIQFGIFELGPGKLGLNGGMDLLFTDIPITIEEDAGFFEVLFSSIAQAVIGGSFGSVKARLGLNYSIRL